MRPLKLDPLLCLNIKEIDDQHQQMIDLINETQQLIDSQDDPAGLLTVLGRLQDLTLQHFTTEEVLMMQYGYPGLQSHKRMHDLSVERTFDFDGSSLQEDPEAAKALLKLLREWLLSHIHEDLEMAEYLRDKGVK